MRGAALVQNVYEWGELDRTTKVRLRMSSGQVGLRCRGYVFAQYDGCARNTCLKGRATKSIIRLAFSD